METKRVFRFIFVLVVGILFFLSMNQQGKATEMRVLTTEEPPMNFMQGDQITGIITEIVEYLLKHTGTQASIKLLPWARIYQIGLEEPNVVLFTAARTEQRENLFQWVGPVINKRWVLYAKRGSNLQIKSLHDAKKVKRIAVMRGDAREKMLRAKGFENLDLVENHAQGLGMLMLGRVDLFASADIEGPILAKKAKIASDDIKIVWTFQSIQSYILISKTTSKQIVTRWQETFEQAKRSGTIVQIAKKWARILDMPLTGERGVIEVED